jgi:flagellar hook-associated protein 3 FlgL
MKISTSLMYDRAVSQMTSSQNRLAESQAQLSSGKNVLRPSDAPDQATAIQRLKSVIDRQKSFEATIESANRHLQAEETALTGVTDLLTRFKELMMQASNDSYSTTDRQAIAIELKGLQDDLLSFANVRDVNGAYLFSGSRVFTQPFAADAAGRITYQGDETVNLIDVGDQRSIRGNRTGTEVFSRVVREQPDGTSQGVSFFEALQDSIVAVRSENREGMRRGLSEVESLSETVALGLARIGSDMNVVDAQRSVMEETSLQLKVILSEIEDLDYTEAVTKMQKQMLALEASQASFAQISRLSLFEYIR